MQAILVPPPQMVANMRVGTMDAFCVGEVVGLAPVEAAVAEVVGAAR